MEVAIEACSGSTGGNKRAKAITIKKDYSNDFDIILNAFIFEAAHIALGYPVFKKEAMTMIFKYVV